MFHNFTAFAGCEIANVFRVLFLYPVIQMDLGVVLTCGGRGRRRGVPRLSGDALRGHILRGTRCGNR